MKSNAELYEDVMSKLKFEPMIDPSKITIAVNDGVITLGGTVGSYSEKESVTRAINSIYGVKAVANDIEVDVMEEYRKSDADIASAAVNALEWHPNIPHNKIKIAVENGRVTLTGEVNWWYQRKSAEEAIRNLMGVRSVNNQIAIKPSVSPADVKQKIIDEFERNADIDAHGVQVEVLDGKVILKGTVRSWAETQEAQRAAWSVPGVKEVDNRLEISYI